MKSDKNKYYVYVYIDPRNHQEFYYGKGIGNRKFSHLKDESDSQKSKTIKEIQKAGMEPLIRVVARGLSEDQALLVEKTLIWKLGRNLTNIASGHFGENFRPHNFIHKEIFGFDYENSVYYVNVGEGNHRSWDDCKKFGFVAAGQSWEKWGQKMYALEIGDIIAAYLSEFGYVGVGRVTSKACPAVNFKFKGKLLSKYDLVQANIFSSEKDLKDEEHLVAVEWLATVGREDAKFKSGIFTYPSVIASMENQHKTIKFLEEQFQLNFEVLLSKGNDNAA